MIKDLIKEIRKINDENYNSITCQSINILEFDVPEGTLYLDFNDKLSLKLTINQDKRFINFEVLAQDKRFWSDNPNQVFKYKASNSIDIISDFYLNAYRGLECIDLLGCQSYLQDGVKLYLNELNENKNIYLNQLKELFIALLDWSYNAPEFNIKVEIKSSEFKLLNSDQKTVKIFRLIVDNDKLNEDFQITGFNFIENFNTESSMIILEIKKEDIKQ
jgi:hypothetical protein